jgi:hypothetical protein
MNFTNNNIILCMICSFFLIACQPTKHEDKQTEQKSIEGKNATAVLKPAPEHEEKLNIEKQMELKNEEENLEPAPG